MRLPNPREDGPPPPLRYGDMALRDYFAAEAMAAICIATSRGTISDHDTAWFEMLSRKAYLAADAMLKARRE